MSSLDSVTRLSRALSDRYRIEGEVGEGGMATVYLARDLKHNRDVALKVLKPELAAVVGAERFLAEIETTANLQHPHILPLYDSGEADGFLFYVMPHVEGESLRERLDREKQLPVDEAVRIATAVANALDYAHRHGVIHRDIKPANVLLQDGQPMVGDFGIALAVGSAGGARLTETGLSVGTPYYMSPEQATGDQMVGPATDIYALGAVLYEMLVGDPPYVGSTAQAVLGKIIQGKTVAPATVRRSIPANVDAVVRRALEKLPADRFRDARALAKALADSSFRHDLVGASGGGRTGLWNPLSIALAVTTAVLGSFLLAQLGEDGQPSRHVERFSVPFEPDEEPNVIGLSAFTLSPDGTMLVYRRQPGPTLSLWVRRWDELSARPIPDTDAAAWPAVSPSGTELAFWQNGNVKVLGFAGGPVRTIGPGVAPRWGPDDHLYFGSPGSGTSRAPSSGGPIESVTELQQGDAAQAIMDFLPDGRHGLMMVNIGDGIGEIRTVDLRSGEMSRLGPGILPQYVSTGHLVFLLDGTLMASAFDPDRLELVGQPVPMIEDVGLYSLADDGKLFYALAEAASELFELMWVSRDGVARPVESGWSFDPSPTSGNRGFSLSPDGSRIAVKMVTDLGPDIWVKDLSNGLLSRLTFYDGEDRFPRWADDGRTVTFLSSRDGTLDVWSRSADGTGEPERVFTMGENLAEGFWSPDGEWLILRTGGSAAVTGGRDIYGIRPSVDTSATPLVATEFDESGAAISHDGRWLAYQSDETGRREVFVRPFPDVDRGKWQVSSGGGRGALWAHSGREIFYLTDENEVMVAEIDPGPPFVVGERRMLFDPGDDYYFMNNTTTWEVTEDDQTFLMMRQFGNDDGERRRLILVTNFPERLKERLPN